MRVLKQNLLGIFLAAFILWLVFFLINGLPNSSIVGPDISKDCSWQSVSLDANLDGTFSYSDVPIWISAIFVGFQKFLVANLYDTSLGQFIELKKNVCTSFKAQAISYVTLLIIFFFISKATLSAVNTLIPKIKSIQQKNSLPSAISYLVSSRNFVEAIWSLQFKLIFVTLTIIVIGLNWHSNKASPPAQEKRAVVKKESNKPKAIESSTEVNSKDQALKDEAKLLAEKEVARLNAEKQEARLLAEKEEQEKANVARTEAFKAAQIRQEQQAADDRKRQFEAQQAERNKIESVRRRFEARCNLDLVNAREQAKARYQAECDNTYRNAANNTINRLGVIACVTSVGSKAEEYAQVVFKACMSGAP